MPKDVLSYIRKVSEWASDKDSICGLLEEFSETDYYRITDILDKAEKHAKNFESYASRGLYKPIIKVSAENLESMIKEIEAKATGKKKSFLRCWDAAEEIFEYAGKLLEEETVAYCRNRLDLLMLYEHKIFRTRYRNMSIYLAERKEHASLNLEVREIETAVRNASSKSVRRKFIENSKSVKRVIKRCRKYRYYEGIVRISHAEDYKPHHRTQQTVDAESSKGESSDYFDKLPYNPKYFSVVSYLRRADKTWHQRCVLAAECISTTPLTKDPNDRLYLRIVRGRVVRHLNGRTASREERNLLDMLSKASEGIPIKNAA